MSVSRVLVVDDKLDMAEMIADDLADRGYDGLAVSSGQAALHVLRSQRVHALVTDLRMPEMDGFKLLAASRDLDPSRPVIVMTAFSSIDTAMRAFEVGAYQYLMKPFRLEALAKVLDRALLHRDGLCGTG
ncbi:MAG: response regulator, partial [Polyangiaceae bacterium]